MIANDRPRAKTHFTWLRANTDATSYENTVATAELKKLSVVN